MDYLPFLADIKNRPVLVVGGGEIAARKIKLLNRAGAHVLVVANNLGNTLRTLLNKNNIEWIARTFNPIQLDHVFFVIAATDDRQLNAQIFSAANTRYKLVNVVDDHPKCSFIFPSIIDRTPLIIAISSSGTAPILARLLREKIEALLPTNLGLIAKLAGRWRNKVKQRYKKISDRRHFWESIFNGLFASQVVAGNFEKACCTIERELKNYSTNRGEIILVGAGPGDSGLLTLRGLQVIQSADAVLYDNLVSDEVLELVRRDADLIYVGKRSGTHSIEQEKTNQLLVMLAKQGKRVVRLKGGDPFIFGRGGEELQAAQIAGIPFQVVPGITSAVGATAYAGIPLTHREYAQSVIFITGHYCKNNQNIDWPSLARIRHQTLVIYMGTIKASEITIRLLENGCNSTIPIAVISRGTYQDQQVLIGTLEQLEMLARNSFAPTLLVIGEVVKLHKKLSWFQDTIQKWTGKSSIINLA